MSHLILIRHSVTRQVPGVSSHEWELTEEGRDRCKALADQLRPYRIAAIATSDEQKAVATASILVAHLGVAAPLIVEPGFRETRRVTAPYFQNSDEFREAIRAAMLSPNRLLYGEESFTEARLRFSRSLFQLVTANPNKTLAVVTHGTIMSLLLGYAAGLDTYKTWTALDMPAYAVLTPNLDLLDLKTSVG